MKRKRKNGFSLVELIVVITIIAIIAVIAGAIFLSVQKSTLQKSYENVKSYIETRAAKYASDTGVTRVSVDTLIKNGYAQADNELGELKNPKDNTNLNCYFVNTEIVDGEYESTLSEDHEEDQNGKCANYQNSDLTLFMNAGNGFKKVADKNWYKTTGKVTLGISTSTSEYKPITDESAIYSWHDNYGTTSSEKEIILETNDETEYTRTYQVTVVYKTTNDSGEEQKIEGRTQGIVQIDNKAPEIRRAAIENEDIWTNTPKKIESKITDSGSGVKGIYLLNSNTSCPTNANLYTTNNYESNIYKTQLDNGNYTICAMDNVSNITKVAEEATATNKVTIAKIDKEPIKCQLVVDSSKYKTTNGWYKEDFDIELKIISPKVIASGIKQTGITTNKNEEYNGLTTKRYTTETNSTTYYGYVMNNAGTVGKCEPITIKLDKTKPTCNIEVSGEQVVTNNNSLYNMMAQNAYNWSSINQANMPGANSNIINHINGTYTITGSNGNNITVYDNGYFKDNNTGRIYDGQGYLVLQSRTYNNEEPRVVPQAITYDSSTGTWSANDMYYIRDHYQSIIQSNPGIYSGYTYPSTNTSTSTWYKSDVILTASGQDGLSGINTAYIKNNNMKVYSLSSNTNGTTVSATITDKAGNANSCSKIIKIDKTAPIYEKVTGEMTNEKIPTASYKDDYSGIDKVEYYITTKDVVPSNGNEGWKTDTTYSAECGNVYFAYSRAIDKAGNVSEPQNIGKYFQACYAAEYFSSSGGIITNGSIPAVAPPSNDYYINNSADWAAIYNSTTLSAEERIALGNVLHNDSVAHNQQTGGGNIYNQNGTWVDPRTGNIINNASGVPSTASFNVTQNPGGTSTVTGTTTNGQSINITRYDDGFYRDNNTGFIYDKDGKYVI